MKKALYVAILLLTGSLYSMEPSSHEALPPELDKALEDLAGAYVGAFPVELREILTKFLTGQAVGVPEQEGIDRYAVLRALLQSRQYKQFDTNALIDHIVEMQYNQLVERESKEREEPLTEEEKKNLRKVINPWYIAVELGTPGALNWIQTHSATSYGKWNQIRDAYNRAIKLEREQFTNALEKLGANKEWTKPQADQ